MAVEFLVNRLKALVLLLFGVFRRAMCCLRRRRRSSCDSIPLSAVGVVPNASINSNTVSFLRWDFLGSTCKWYFVDFFKYFCNYYISNYWGCLLKELEKWDHWEENPVVVVPDKPVNTVQSKIEQYRQQVTKSTETPVEEQQPNFFEVNLILKKHCGKPEREKGKRWCTWPLIVGYDTKNYKANKNSYQR